MRQKSLEGLKNYGERKLLIVYGEASFTKIIELC